MTTTRTTDNTTFPPTQDASAAAAGVDSNNSQEQEQNPPLSKHNPTTTTTTTTTTTFANYGSIITSVEQEQEQQVDINNDDKGRRRRRGNNNNSNGDADSWEPLLLTKEQQQQQQQRWQLSWLSSSTFHKLTFQWLSPILELGYQQKHLEQMDLNVIPLPEHCHTQSISDIFLNKHWKNELQTSKSHSNHSPSLIRALYHSFGYEFWFKAGFLKLCHDLAVFIGPITLHKLINYVRDNNNNDSSLWIVGLSWTIALTISQILMSLCLRHYFYICYMTGLKIRTSVIIGVYQKALNLSQDERQLRSLGEITNLASIDAQRLQDLTTYLHSLWSSPLQISISLVFLWRLLGPSSLGGVLVILIMIPVTKMVATWMGGMQQKLMQAKDRRVEWNAEVLSGIKVIKFQAWEEAFGQLIRQYRDAELVQLFRYFVGTSCSRMLWVFTPLAVALATFACYVWSGHQLDVGTALTALTLFDILRFPLFMLPTVINNTVEALVSLRRVEDFLQCDDYQPVPSHDLTQPGRVRFQTVSAAYDTRQHRKKQQQQQQQQEQQNNNAEEDESILPDKEWEVSLLKAQLDEAERKIRELARSTTATTNIGGGSSSGNDEENETTATSDTRDSTNATSAAATATPLCLRRIDFDFRPGEFVAIVGGVGCGKSSFLNVILGELQALTGGQASVKGSLAYFSQTPFIMNATLRDNILFGHVNDANIDEELYQRALTCCSLRHDLELLPDGDQTEIGEKGITLSGGQKARIALARTVYHSADISIIDDALSAVDAHVAKELFEGALLGELLRSPNDGSNRKRGVILVTNALQYLSHPRVDRIAVIEEGRLVEEGSYKQLANKPDSVFARILAVIKETGIEASLTGESLTELPKDAPEAGNKSGERTTAERRSSEKEMKVAHKFMTEEFRQKGHVGLDVYMFWTKAAGGKVIVPVVILFSYAVVESFRVLSTWWLTYWSAHGHTESQQKLLGIYALINLAAAIVGLLGMLVTYYFGIRASRRLFEDMLENVLYAQMSSFFDTTPVGRLINRFSKDIYTVDEQLCNTLRTYLSTLYTVLSTVVVIAYVEPAFLVFLFPICFYYLVQQNYFTLTYRELKRLDSASRSPIYALLGESIDGVTVIRAYSAQNSLLRRLTSMLDAQQHAYFLTCAAQSWLAVRLELVGTLIITFTCLSAVVQRWISGADEISAGLAGLAISYSLSVTQSLNWSVRMASDMEATMVAVERLKEYTQLEHEGARHQPVDQELPEKWPIKGEIEFKGVKLKYRPELSLVLKGLNLCIPAGSKVGVVGRTGAGKSTLMVALMRIVEVCEGCIYVDGIDTSKIGLAKLRRSISVIPQDPALFSGTVRSNLDPFFRFESKSLYEALEKVGLFCSINGSSHSTSSLSNMRVDSLDDPISEGGMNYSQGQRQLIVIARALLRGARIVILDEATASIDAETDAAIQRVLRTQFDNATCITVAHRLNTIMDSDRILVMDSGKVAEFDSPSNLLKRGGMFRDLVEAAS